LSFEANRGQADAQVNFLSRGTGYSLFLTPSQAMLDLNQGSQENVLSMQLLGSNPAARAVGLDQLTGVSNYLIGNDPSQWHTNIPNYARVEYQNVYAGINLVYYGNNQQHLEYDFVLAPGANPSAIQLSFQGTQGVKIDSQGNLVLHTSGGDVVEQAPVLYQDSNGVRQSVSGHYVLEGNGEVGFAVGPYDPGRPLVIDPTYSLVYSTYLGGKGTDAGYGIAVDSAGNAYVTGLTASTNFPTQNPWQKSNAGGNDVFVTKLNASGSGLVYSTYLGGSGDDDGSGIAVDTSGNAYVTGFTTSTNFPTLNAFQPASGGGTDAFVAKLNATGTLVYSSYLGGSGSDTGYGIAVDGSGDAYVGITTQSANMPVTPGAFQTTLDAGGYPDGFIAKVNPSGSALVYGTYLGGSFGTSVYGIAVDTAGEAYLTGNTQGGFPTTANAFQPTFPFSSTVYVAAFVTKMNATGSGLVYSTYLGGTTPVGSATSYDAGGGIAVDTLGNAYVTGSTRESDFPTKNAFQPAYGGGSSNAFVTELNPSQAGAASLVYSSYLGGSGADNFLQYLFFGPVSTLGILSDRGAIAVGAASKVYLTGTTSSTNFPTANAFQASLGGGTDAFVASFDTSQAGAASLVYSSYLGGSGGDGGQGIAVDTSGNAYVTGYTNSKDFPTTRGAFQGKNGGSNATYDAFVTKIDPPPALTDSPAIDSSKDSWLAAAPAVSQRASALDLAPLASSLVETLQPALPAAPAPGPVASFTSPASHSGDLPASGAPSPVNARTTDAVFAVSHPAASEDDAWLFAPLSAGSLDAM
jgi:hypothetical protein